MARFDSEADNNKGKGKGAGKGKECGPTTTTAEQQQQQQGECGAAPVKEPLGPSNFALLRRALYLLYLFSAAIVTAALAAVSESFRSPYWYRMLACAISRAGAAFIKWGQWASARPDIFPVRCLFGVAFFGFFGGVGVGVVGRPVLVWFCICLSAMQAS